MPEQKEIYPEAKADRRLFPNIPREGKSRRQKGERYLSEMPIDIFRNSEDPLPLFSAFSLDISYSGVLVSLPRYVEPLIPGNRLFLRFDLPPGLLPEGYESRVSVAAKVIRCDCIRWELALNFAENLDNLMSRRRWRWFEWLGVSLIGLTLMIIVFMRMDNVFYFLFDVPVFLYGICTSAYLVSRFLIALFFTSVEIDPEWLPTVTIVIPCFNEEEFITRTMRCAIDQNYPEDKLQIILVDDGSTDKSVERAREFAVKARTQMTGDRLQIIVHPKNRGKREVLATGVLAATSDLMVFVDSDSFLETEAIRQVVQPFRNPKIGAVCGRCDVENKWTNYITKMQAVRYYIAFHIFKGAEAVFDAVTCLSGPLACYRRDLVLKNLDAWLQQKFFGMPATFGDDRSLTNFILAEYQVGYQHESICTTIVPSTMRQFLKQQMRWKRSWFRESLRAACFMWRTEPFSALSFYAGLFIPILAPFIVLRSLVYIPLVHGDYPITFFLGLIMMGMLVSATYLILRRSAMWIYGGLFCFFYVGVLLWQMPIALVTFWKSNWGTRATAADVGSSTPKPGAVS